MAIYVYITENCRKEAEKYNYVDTVDKFKRKIEVEQNLNLFNRFPQPFMTKKFATTRLVAAETNLHDDTILCFISFLYRGNQKYSEFIREPKVLLKLIPEENELEQYLSERKHQDPIDIPETSSEETNFLFSVHRPTSIDDYMILESEEWIRKISNNEYLDYLTRYCEILVQIVDNIKLDEQIGNQPKTIEFHSDNNRFSVSFYTFHQFKKIFLLSPNFNDYDSRNNEEVLEKLKSIDSEDDLLRLAGKSYPSIIIADERAWLNIQKNAEGNISLSSEESGILNEIQNSDNKLKYPLFINGRAGSGKSTVLYYLFSDIAKYFITNSQTTIKDLPFPVFLTYGKRLLETAKEYTKVLLKANAKSQIDGMDDIPESKIDSFINSSFKTFSEFLISLLTDELKIKYPPDKYVEFVKFKDFWKREIPKNPNHKLKKLTPEIAWHIIRTYVKGMQLSDETDQCDAEYYASEMPRELKSVSDETFELVYNEIWLNWFQPKCLENDYWDIQDIARTLLNGNIDISNHSAVYCDEAQDFTNIELQLIFKLSLYSKRQLPYKSLKHIPFAFAGDPFQTLNPTGFDWKAIQANFHNQIAAALQKSSKTELKFNYKELYQNYRSTKNIVNFSNLLQLMRAVLFKIKELHPQQAWFGQHSSIPSYFSFRDPIVEQAFCEEKDLVIIIDCLEGEEEVYYNGDDKLKSLNRSDSKSNHSAILSPITAKGLEFNRVVVYKFGDSFYVDESIDKQLFKKILIGSEDVLDDHESDKLLPIQYFFNRLYVAVTRAKKRLYIVDTENGYQSFWEYVKEYSDDFLIRYHDIDKNNQWDEEDHINVFGKGTKEDWGKDKNDPLELAQKFENEGIIQRNHSLLKTAANYYLDANQKSNAIKCKAQASEILEEYEVAGNEFQEIGDYSSALRNYWKGLRFESVINLGENYSEVRSDFRYKLSQLLNNNGGLEQYAEFLTDLDNEFVSNKKMISYMLSDKVWREAFVRIIENIGNELEKRITQRNFNSRTVSILISGLQTLVEEGVLEKDKVMVLPRLLFLNESYEKVVEYLESIDATSNVLYCSAKERTSTGSEFLHYAGINENHNAIVEWYRANNSELNINDKTTILHSLRQTNNKNEFFELLEDVKEKLPKQSNEIIKGALELYAEYGQYQKAYSKFSEILELDSIRSVFNEYSASKVSNQLLKLAGAIFVTKLVQNNDVDSALTIIENNYVFEVKKTLINSFISACAKYLNHENLGKESQDKLNQFFAEAFIDNRKKRNAKLYKDVDFRIIGGAIERANKITHSLKYYEKIIRDGSRYSKEDQKYAELRWAVCKKRHFEHKNSERDREQYEEILEKYDIPAIAGLSDYPDVEGFYLFEDVEKETPEHINDSSVLPMPNNTIAQRKLSSVVGVSRIILELSDSINGNLVLEKNSEKQRIRLVFNDEITTIKEFSKLTSESDSNELIVDGSVIGWELPLWNIKIFKETHNETNIIDVHFNNNYLISVAFY